MKFRIKPIDIIGSIVYLAVTGFVYVGFYFQDSHAVAMVNSRFIYLFILLVKLLGPVFILGFLALYFLVRLKSVSVKGLMLSLGTTVVCLIVLFIAGLLFYGKSDNYKKLAKEYHPFLQIVPALDRLDEMGKPDTIDIACLGGSTTEFRDSTGRGWPDRLEEFFAGKIPGKRVRFYNFGKQWYSSLHILINYETNIRPHKPDIIICMEGINDLLHNADKSYFSHAPFRTDYGHFYGPVNRIVAGRNLFRDLADSITLWYGKRRTTLELYDFPGLTSFSGNLNTLIDLAKTDGTIVVLMTQPYIYKKNMTNPEKAKLSMVNVESYGPDSSWSYDTALRGMEAYDNEMRNIAGTRNAYLVDLEREIPKTTEYFTDDVHYTDKAFDRVAEAIFNGLMRQNIVQSASKTSH